MRARKPWVRARLIVLGWKVRFMMRYLVVDYGPEWPPFKETGDSREIGGVGQFPLRGFVGKEYKKERYLKLFGYVYYS